MQLPNLDHELSLWQKGFLVIGIDEVGRGAFAGPLFAAGVIINPKSNIKHLLSYGINDSKKLKPNERNMLAKVIQKEALAYYVSEIGVAEINSIGVGKATYKAMRDVVKNIISKSQMSVVSSQLSKPFVLVDGFCVKNIKGIGLKYQKGIIHGDAISLSIAAASIIAKVARDKYMKKISKSHPQYGWGQNKGYGTLMHREALNKFGATPLHRTDFIENFV